VPLAAGGPLDDRPGADQGQRRARRHVGRLQGDPLPYRIELRSAGDGSAVERVLARAFNAALARAIFKAAQGEHPGGRITLSRGSRLIADPAK